MTVMREASSTGCPATTRFATSLRLDAYERMSDARAMMRKAKEDRAKAAAPRKGGRPNVGASGTSGKERLEAATYSRVECFVTAA